MTIDELERAVATAPVYHTFEPARRVPGITLVAVCGGLITVEESGLVRLVRKLRSGNRSVALPHCLIHYTAKGTLQALLQEDFPNPHSLLAAVCMTHLAENGFQNTTISSEEEFATFLKEDPLLAYASEAWAFHARPGMHVEHTERLTVRFVRSSNAFPALTSHDRSEAFDILTPLHVLALYDLPLNLIEDYTHPNAMTTVLQQSALMIASRFGHGQLLTVLLTLP